MTKYFIPELKTIFDQKMYPSKNMLDYMNEMNRLFPRTTENDLYHTPNTTNTNINSPFYQSMSNNRSSSSADSASSESYPDISRWSDRLRPTPNQQIDTPFVIRRQRPIIGRRIFDNQDHLPPKLEPIPKPFEEFSNSVWHTDDQSLFSHTPPKVLVEKKNFTQNVFYELFPTEQKGYEFKTSMSPRSPASNYTPSLGDSPIFSPTRSNFSPNSPKVHLPRMPTPSVFQNQASFTGSPRFEPIRPSKMCTFCRKNGETPFVYNTHTVKEKVGNHNIVTCPILRSHVCSTCGASGDNAHTITYCPVLRSSNNGLPLQSTTITLKNTRVKSNGRRRY